MDTQSASQSYYTTQSGRNALPTRIVERKLTERLRALKPLITDGDRVLEIGCAEGALGKRVKAVSRVDYWGVEPSLDAQLAKGKLDNIVADTLEISAATPRFNLIIAFHVLEHIPDALHELRRWHDLLTDNGMLLIEVPLRGGHVDVDVDLNTEHIHAFSQASLACLLERSQFDLVSMTRGHFESPVYSDSLRTTVRKRPPPGDQLAHLIGRFKKAVPEPFAVFGIGGDYVNYVRPVIGHLEVRSLLDSAPAKSGTYRDGFVIERYNAACHGNDHILVSSIRHEASIIDMLLGAGHPSSKICLLSDIYSDLPE